jgi:hypothetical protein
VGYSVAFALTGQSAAANHGTLVYSVEGQVVVMLTGAQITSAVGSLGYGLSKALSGAAVVSSVGSLSYDLRTGLAGTAVTAYRGTFTVQRTFALTGLVALAYRGTITMDGGTPVGMPFWIDGAQIGEAWIDNVQIASVHFDNVQVWP